MTRKKALKQVRGAIGRERGPAAPTVDLLEPEVRSDLVLPVTRSQNVAGIKQRVKSGTNVGIYVVEWGYDVTEGQADDFHRWLEANEVDLAKHCPRGVEYKGTFVAAFGPAHRSDGRYRTFWVFDSLATIETFGEGGSASFRRLRQELVSHRDDASRTGFSQIYQLAAGTPIY